MEAGGQEREAAREVAGTYTSCLICGSQPLQALSGFAQAGLVRCGACDLTFAGRRASDAELDEHYGGYGDWPDSEITRRRYAELLASFEPYRQTGRIFDMGCGPGYFLEEARARGWEPHGSNVGERALRLCREKGLNVVQAPLAPEAFPIGHFDVVSSFEVFEHLRDPLAELRVLARLVRPGGLLYCTTPNFNSLSRRVLGERWRVISFPEHLVYFTRETLIDWMAAGGFQPVKVESTGISPAIARAALTLSLHRSRQAQPADASAWATTDEHIRAAMERSGPALLVKRAINQALTLTRAGDTLKGRFVRTAEPPPTRT